MTKVKKLIALVRKHPILYDCRVEGHTNSRVKTEVWDKIADELHEERQEIKKKWKNLRDTYVKFQKINKQKSDNGKEWMWALDMKPFAPFFGLNKSIKKFGDYEPSISSNSEDDNSLPNFVKIETSEMIHEDIIPECSETSMDGHGTMSHHMNTATTIAELQENQETESVTLLPRPSKDPISSTKRKKYEKKKKSSSSMDELVDYMPQQVAHDDIDSLLLAYAKTIKKFSAKRQAVTKFKIAQLIMEQEVLELEELANPTFLRNSDTNTNEHTWKVDDRYDRVL